MLYVTRVFQRYVILGFIKSVVRGVSRGVTEGVNGDVTEGVTWGVSIRCYQGCFWGEGVLGLLLSTLLQ